MAAKRVVLYRFCPTFQHHIDDSEAYSVTLRQSLFQTLCQEFALTLSLERQEIETSLLGEPFSFSLGAQNGRPVVTALRLALEWSDRTQIQLTLKGYV